MTVRPYCRTLIESDAFPIGFLSELAERESWRKEVHRPLQHIHKWWAKRLGSVFRGILLGASLPDSADLRAEFYRSHDFSEKAVFDPFMGSGTTVSEAHKLGFVAIGQDINPVAAEAVRIALSNIDPLALDEAFDRLSATIGESVRRLYRSVDSRGRDCDVLYYFWVMQAWCPACEGRIDLFSSYILAQNAYPKRKPEVQIVCPVCGDIFRGEYGQHQVTCTACRHSFDPHRAPVRGTKAKCGHCSHEFRVISTRGSEKSRPDYRLYAKLVLTKDLEKEYLPATAEDRAAYEKASAELAAEVSAGRLALPQLDLDDGFNTRQAINYGFRSWRDFFNDRQLLALGKLQAGIASIPDPHLRDTFLTLFSGVLEFNNLFASYKGEGTGAVRHMFSHHILKPERVPIEANPWGTQKSSGSFLNLFRSRLLRAAQYQRRPTEIGALGAKAVVASPAYSGKVTIELPSNRKYARRGIYLSCGNSGKTKLADASIDLVVTDPPFFDNVHYSELADFFFSWQSLVPRGFIQSKETTRSSEEVQDTSSIKFSNKLAAVLGECNRVLKDDGLLVFTYHHSRDEGWQSLADAITEAGFKVVAAQPVKAEMSVAMPKVQAKEPIQLDTVLVCRKSSVVAAITPTIDEIDAAVKKRFVQLCEAGLKLSRNDEQVIVYGQLLASTIDWDDFQAKAALLQSQPRPESPSPKPPTAASAPELVPA